MSVPAATLVRPELDEAVRERTANEVHLDVEVVNVAQVGTLDMSFNDPRLEEWQAAEAANQPVQHVDMWWTITEMTLKGQAGIDSRWVFRLKRVSSPK